MAGEGFNLGTAYATVELRFDSASQTRVQNAISGALDGIGTSMQSIGSGITNVGTNLVAAVAPLALAFTNAGITAMDFQEQITNIGAVMNLGRLEMDNLADSLQAIGADSRFGPQAVADAFYDIAGGVMDATTHMAILDAAINTATAGNADLTSTTNALISIMNSYQFSADEAALASDVLTRTVATGVGTMDEFAGSLPQVSGLAASLGIEFADLGAMMAYLTTQGNTTSEAATQLSAMMTALLNPNEKMKKALAELGFESGQAAIEQLGLVGAMEAVSGTQTAADNGMAALTGSVEALRGVTAFASGDVEGFFTNFNNGLDGATERAAAIQNTSWAAQWDLLRSSLESLNITLGEVLLPTFMQLVEDVRPIIEQIGTWVENNRGLVAQIGLVVAGITGLGAVMIPVGMAISAVGSIVSTVGAGLSLLLSPVGLVIAGVVALALAFSTNFMGIRDLVQPVLDNIAIGFETLVGVIGNMENILNRGGISLAIAAIVNAFGQMFGLVENNEMGDWALTFGDTVTNALSGVSTFINETVMPAVNGFVDRLVDFWTDIQPGLDSFFQWVTADALPLVADTFTNVIQPAIDLFVDVLFGIWDVISPSLTTLFNWFTADGLPIISDLIGDVGLILGGLIDALATIWDAVSPALTALGDWFSISLGFILTAISDFYNNFLDPFIIEPLVNLFTNLSPGLEAFSSWWQVDGLPFILTAVQTFYDNFLNPYIITPLSTLWDLISSGVQIVADWFSAPGGGLDLMKQGVDNLYNMFLYPFIIQPLSTLWDLISTGVTAVADWFNAPGGGLDMIKTGLQNYYDMFLKPYVIDPLVSLWDLVKSGVDAFKNGLNTAFTWINDNIITPIKIAIESIIGVINDMVTKFNDAKNTITGGLDAYGGVAENANAVGNAVASGQVGWGDVAGALGNAIVAQFRGNALGGAVTAGVPTLVGERGPELFTPHTNGMISSNDDTSRMMGGVSISGVTIYANGYREGQEAARGFSEQLQVEFDRVGFKP